MINIILRRRIGVVIANPFSAS